MGEYKYSEILSKAKTIANNVKTKYSIGNSSNQQWAYYFAKAILKPKTNIKKISIKNAVKPDGTHISRQINRADYKDMAERLVKYVEANKQMLNYVSYKNYKVRTRLYTLFFANILISYDKNKELPSEMNINSKAFTKPSENKNTVFKKWVNKFKFTPKYIDDVCDYILKHFDYQFYYDDHKSNAEVIDTKSGNCTDLLQMLINMAEALGYEWKVIHTKCKQSKVGHVYGMFRKKGINGGNWFIRDIACIADESRYCVWCEVPTGGNKLAENPAWFLANLRR